MNISYISPADISRDLSGGSEKGDVHMSSVMMKIKNSIHRISSVLFWVAVVSLMVMLLTTCYDVIMRYVFAMPTSWTVEINSILMVYVTFLGGAEIVKKKQHIDMNILFNHFSGKAQKSIDVSNSVVALLFCGVLVWMGANATFSTYKYGMYTAGLFQVPLWVIYIIIPVSSVLISLEYLLHIFYRTER